MSSTPIESFPNLGEAAPIVEATIAIGSLAKARWDEATLSKDLIAKLPEYPKSQALKSLQHEIKIENNRPAKQEVVDLGWQGIRFESEDNLKVFQCLRENFVFSQLHPYESWDVFLAEALRLWKIHKETYQPVGIQRLGLRFINRISPSQMPFDLDDYFTGAPQAPNGLGFTFTGFLHHDAFQVPMTDYNVNIVKTIQTGETFGLIFDIDVFTMNVPDESMIEKKLVEMRHLKNKVFFGGITEKAIKELS